MAPPKPFRRKSSSGPAKVRAREQIREIKMERKTAARKVLLELGRWWLLLLVTVLADGISCTFLRSYAAHLVVFLIYFLKHHFRRHCFVYRHVYVYSCFFVFPLSPSLRYLTLTLDYLFCKSHGARFAGEAVETIKATAAKQNR